MGFSPTTLVHPRHLGALVLVFRFVHIKHVTRRQLSRQRKIRNLLLLSVHDLHRELRRVQYLSSHRSLRMQLHIPPSTPISGLGSVLRCVRFKQQKGKLDR